MRVVGQLLPWGASVKNLSIGARCNNPDHNLLLPCSRSYSAWTYSHVEHHLCCWLCNGFDLRTQSDHREMPRPPLRE